MISRLSPAPRLQIHADAEAMIQVARTLARDGGEVDEAERRVAAQMPIDEKRAMATHVIDNSGDLDETRRQVEKVFAELSGA